MRMSQKLHIGQVRDRLLLVMVLTLAVSSMYPLICVHADDRNRPVRIGVLTESWGPTPAAVGLRDGLTALGYQEDRDYFLGIRFTQGNHAALSALFDSAFWPDRGAVASYGQDFYESGRQAARLVDKILNGQNEGMRLALLWVQQRRCPGGLF